MNSGKKFTFRDFSDLDQSDNADFLIKSMEAHYQLDSMKAIKRRALDSLNLKFGDSVIELGCGLGCDAELLADRVGKAGRVVAIDASSRMINEARKRSSHANVAYFHADAAALDFPDGEFSACRAERLLVSQENINRVISEMLRVTQTGGRICITELDFSTMLLIPQFDNVTDKIISHWTQLVRNPFIGKKLGLLLKKSGLNLIEEHSEVFIVNSYKMLKKIIDFESMLDDMLNDGKIISSQKEATIDSFQKADGEGNFFWSIGLMTVVARR